MKHSELCPFPVRLSFSRGFMQDRSGTSRVDHFPDTQTWVRALVDDPTGLSAVKEHLMSEPYYRALQAYFLGSTFRRMGDAKELVHEFYTHRLSRDDFLLNWRKTDKRLRHWLINGFKFFLLEHYRRLERAGRVRPEEDIEVVADETPRDQELDRAFALGLVSRACRVMDAVSEEEGTALNWKFLVRHECEGESYASIARDHALSPVQVRSRARTARMRFKRVLQDILRQDGVPPHQLRAELRKLQECLQP